MTKELRILLLEDNMADAEMLEEELRRTKIPFSLKRVFLKESFIKSFEDFSPDIILADYTLPSFDGMTALSIVKEMCPEVPFIFVSGTIEEGVAIEALKNGAVDYVYKNRISKLAPAVRRALSEIKERRERERAINALIESEERFRTVTESAGDAIICLKAPDTIYFWNKRAEDIFGYQINEVAGKSLHDLIVPERDNEKAKEGLEFFFKTGIGIVIGKTLELMAVRKGGAEFPVELSVSAMKIRGEWHATGIVRDITERKKADEKLREEIELNTHLLEINDAVANIIDMDKMMARVVHCGRKITGCDICFSYIYDIDAANFKPWQSYGLEQSMTAMFMTETIDEKTDFIKKAMEGRKPVIISDKNILQSSFGYLPEFDTAIAVPLIGSSDYLGLIIGIYKKPREFTERDMKVMEGITNQVSIALEQSRLHRESVDRAMELSRKIETIQVMHEIDRNILSTLESEDILEIAARMTAKIISSDRVAVLLVDRERGGFVYKAGFGISFTLKGGLVPFGDTSASEVIKTGRHQFVSDISQEKKLLPLEMKLLNEGYRSHIRAPLIVKGEIIAMLIIGSKRAAAYTPEDLSTLEKIAAQISVALENARLVIDLKDLFIGTVKSLASAIDAKSPWTAGHSDRVTRYAVDIGSKMGFSSSEIKDIELGGLLHDIGKLGTYETILDKPGKLTDEEFELIKQHPIKGAEILTPIKQIRHVIPIVRHHHERYDGKGYPDGLKGEEIPLPARIMCVADSVDAMGADRPYRKGLSMNMIVGELKKCSGSQFDPRIVDVFLKLSKT